MEEKYVEVSTIVEKLRELAGDTNYNSDMFAIGYHLAMMGAANMLEDAPTADVAPVIHARWYVAEWNSADAERADSFYCNKCHCIEPSTMRFCPHCGAKMENGEDYAPRTLKDAKA